MRFCARRVTKSVTTRIRVVMSRVGTKRSVSFPLDVEEGWPPVAMESLPFEVVPGGVKLLVAPLFVKKLSVGDVITVRQRLGRVASWKHKQRSGHSTVWLLRTGSGASAGIARVLKRLHVLGCSCSNGEQLGVYAIDVPPETPMAPVDAVLATLDAKKVAIAYPSFRHPEPVS